MCREMSEFVNLLQNLEGFNAEIQDKGERKVVGFGGGECIGCIRTHGMGPLMRTSC
jgi:hypothetical protein